MSEKTSSTLSGTVEKIMESPSLCEPDRAQILVEAADHSYQEICIENTLIDENRQEVHLKPGAKVQVTVRSRAAGNDWPGK
jgi:hypothetical protein